MSIQWKWSSWWYRGVCMYIFSVRHTFHTNMQQWTDQTQSCFAKTWSAWLINSNVTACMLTFMPELQHWRRFTMLISRPSSPRHVGHVATSKSESHHTTASSCAFMFKMQIIQSDRTRKLGLYYRYFTWWVRMWSCSASHRYVDSPISLCKIIEKHNI